MLETFFSSKYFHWLLISLLCGIGCIMLFPSGYLPGYLDDTRFNFYVMEHGYRWLQGIDPEFWTAGFFYPYNHNIIALSDSHIGALPFYAFFRYVGLDREHALYAWVVMASSLNFFATYWVLRRWHNHSVAAACGAFIFSFSLPAAALALHTQLIPRFMIPLAFYFLIKFFRTNAVVNLALTLVCLVYQMYLGIYMGYFLLIGLSFVSLFALYINKFSLPITNKTLLLYPVLLLVTVLALLPLEIPYANEFHQVGPQSWYASVLLLLPHWQSYFIPASGSMLWKFMPKNSVDLKMIYEHSLFIGAFPLLALLISLFSIKNKPASDFQNPTRLMFGVIIGCVLITLVEHDMTVYRYIYLLPGVGAIRAITRIILMLLFPIAAILANVITRCLNVQLNSLLLRYALCFAFVFFVVLDQSSVPVNFSIKQTQQRVALITRQLDVKKDTILWIHKSNDYDTSEQVDAMLASQNLGILTVNGYSSKLPRGYDITFSGDKNKVCQQWERLQKHLATQSAIKILGDDCSHALLRG